MRDKQGREIGDGKGVFPYGRIRITGTVRAVDKADPAGAPKITGFTRDQMLLETDDGESVYGLVPIGFTPDKGKRIEFTADFHRNHDWEWMREKGKTKGIPARLRDGKLAHYKRPMLDNLGKHPTRLEQLQRDSDEWDATARRNAEWQAREERLRQAALVRKQARQTAPVSAPVRVYTGAQILARQSVPVKAYTESDNYGTSTIYEHRDATAPVNVPAVRVPSIRRLQMVGTITRVTERTNAYGTYLKMDVQTIAGWTVTGSVPRGFLPLIGAQVSFVADVEPYPYDRTGGAFKRPTQAQMVKHPVLAEEVAA